MSLPPFSLLQTARIAYMAGNGASAREIALDSTISASPEQITFYVDRLGLPPLPKPGEPRTFPITVPSDLSKAIDVAALMRNLTRAQLAERIVVEVLASQLVGAVLDDGVS